MTSEEFHQLTHWVRDRKHAPAALFFGGLDDWHSRAHLAHFLAMPDMEHEDEALELFRSVVEAEVDEEKAPDVEEKVFALQRLAELERARDEKEPALRHINQAIELAESTDFLYRYVLRGDLWAARWNLLHKMGRTEEAEGECDERLAAYEDIPLQSNSYVYYGYRFKAHLAAEKGEIFVAKDYMHMALHAMAIPDEAKPAIDEAFAATHENIAFILNDIDRVTPPPETLSWDI